LAYLKVVDFDWAGIVGNVQYSSIRNPEIHWPGVNGKTITINHDNEMISHWHWKVFTATHLHNRYVGLKSRSQNEQWHKNQVNPIKTE